MYRVLYRKWRPAAFSDVVGQSHITDTLRHEIESGRLAHAYLFTGSRGTGKTTCAKILAKAVNCLHPRDGDPCNECEVCRGIDRGSILDVVEIDAASNNGVDNIRDLREEANFTPAVGKYRVYIIDEVHMLSTGAFNALLKTLEEPPEHVLFILATTEVHKLPATILSRCQRFDFMRIPIEEIANRLLYVAEREDFSLTPDAARLIGRLADGGLRDALSLLDQCAGVAGEEKTVTTDTVSAVAGLAGRDHLFELSRAVRQKDSAAALDCIERLHNASRDMERLCEELISHFRNLMLVKAMKSPGELLAYSDQEIDRLREEAAGFSMPGVLSCLRSLQDTLERLRSGASRRIEMEMLFLRLTTPSLDSDSDALLRRIADLESAVRALSGRTLGGGAQAATQSVVAEKGSNPAEIPLASAAPSLPTAPIRESEPSPTQTENGSLIDRAEEVAERYRLESLEEPPEDLAEPEETRKVPDRDHETNLESVPSETPVNMAKSSADTEKAQAGSEAASRPLERPNTGEDEHPFADWPDVVAMLGKKNPLMASVLRGSAAYLQGDLLLIDSRNAQFLDLIREGARNRSDIREAALAVTGRQFRLGPYRKEEQHPEADPFTVFVDRLRGTDAKINQSE